MSKGWLLGLSLFVFEATFPAGIPTAAPFGAICVNQAIARKQDADPRIRHEGDFAEKFLAASRIIFPYGRDFAMHHLRFTALFKMAIG